MANKYKSKEILVKNEKIYSYRIENAESDLIRIKEFIKFMRSKKYFNDKSNNKAFRRNKNEDFKKIFDLASKKGYLYDKFSLESKKKKRNLPFLQDFIRINNTLGGIYSDVLLDGITSYNIKTNFIDFLYVMIETFNSKKSKEFKEYFYKYIDKYSYLNLNSEDKKYLSNRKNCLKLYTILSRGGDYYEKGNKVLSILSLFYSLSIYEEKDISINIKNKVLYKHYSFESIVLSKKFIIKLIEENYITKDHIDLIIYKKLENNNYYIQKKKRKKRTYTRDFRVKSIKVNELLIRDEFITCNDFNASVKKLKRTMINARKAYVPVDKKDDFYKTRYVYNKLIDKNFFYTCINKIVKKQNDICKIKRLKDLNQR